MRLLVLSLTTLTLLPTTALADAASNGDVRGEIRQENFDDELVAGDLLGPGGDAIIVRGGRVRQTLIRAREHFIPEMMHSVEDL